MLLNAGVASRQVLVEMLGLVKGLPWIGASSNDQEIMCMQNATPATKRGALASSKNICAGSTGTWKFGRPLPRLWLELWAVSQGCWEDL